MKISNIPRERVRGGSFIINFNKNVYMAIVRRCRMVTQNVYGVFLNKGRKKKNWWLLKYSVS